MSRKSTGIVAGTGAALALAIGTSTVYAPEHSPSFSIETSNPYGAKLEKAAGQMITLARKSSSHYEDKPAYTTSFEVPSEGGGALTYAVQTARSEHRASQAELIEIQRVGRSVRGVKNFDLSFYARNDGTWNVTCQTDPYSNGGTSLEAIGEKSVTINDVTDHNPENVQLLMNDELLVLQNAIHQAETDEAISLPGDPCHPNIG